MTTRLATVAACMLLLLAWVRPAGAEPMFLSKQVQPLLLVSLLADGGGLLTVYGRSLSGQELSTFRHVNTQPSAEGTVSGEEAFLYDLLGKSLGPVQLGVSLRPAYLHYESGTFSDHRNLLMNADVQGGWSGHGWTAYRRGGPEAGHWPGHVDAVFQGTLDFVDREQRLRSEGRPFHPELRRLFRGSHVAQPQRARLRQVRPGIRCRGQPCVAEDAGPGVSLTRARRIHHPGRRPAGVQHDGACAGGLRLHDGARRIPGSIATRRTARPGAALPAARSASRPPGA